jgi:hypothetical protein
MGRNIQRYGLYGAAKMAGRSESDYREVVFEREGKEPLHGFMWVDRGMVIVSGYGRHKERRYGLSLVGAAVPPRDPNDDEDEEDEETGGDEDDDREPAVIREPDED